MKKWIVGAALLVFISLQVAAQQGKREQTNPEDWAKRATEKKWQLNFSFLKNKKKSNLVAESGSG